MRCGTLSFDSPVHSSSIWSVGFSVGGISIGFVLGLSSGGRRRPPPGHPVRAHKPFAFRRCVKSCHEGVLEVPVDVDWIGGRGMSRQFGGSWLEGARCVGLDKGGGSAEMRRLRTLATARPLLAHPRTLA